ncbi:MAG: hypothetical protein JWP29_5519, partial [Rhodoferax sp.]|nr:hypothetical protein [Rhodoferax sp.]
SIQQPLTVKPAPLNIIANNLSKAANTVNPPLTVTYSGFANSDGAANLTRQPAITTITTTTSAAGSYPIIVSGAASPNYSIYYTAGTLTVLGGAITTAAPAIKYPTVSTYVNGTPIAPLSPINTGGNVPEAVYAQVSTIAGTPNVTGSANGTGAAASFGQPYGAAFDGDGNLYITEQVNNLIRKITPGGVVSTFAGNGVAGYADGAGAAAQFNFPTGIAINAAGEIIVADQGTNILRKISPQGVVSYYAGNGSSLNGQLNQASFYGPEGLAFDKAGNLFVADGFNKLIRKITPAGIVSTFAGRQGVQGRDDGPGTSATFVQPAGIATDALGNVYVTELYIIRKITPDGTVSTLAGSGLNGSKDGIGVEATFGIPQGIAVDAAGNVYVMDITNLRKITPNGRVTTMAGVGNEPGSTDGIGIAARFFFASGLTISAAGDLYASDYSTIRKISLNGYSIDKILPQGLSFDPTTGIISGTPTAPSPSTIYTITANNVNGGSTTSVTIKVASTNASLANFAINSGVISPSFSSNILNYTANVNNSVASVAVIPTANDKNSTIKINGIIVNSGTVSGNIALTVGANVITASVIAENGATSKTYTLNITRAPATNANLANLTVSDATLSPSFASATTAYSASVSNSVAAVTVTSVTSSSASTVKVNGSIVTSGVVSGSLPLNVGNNIITVMVTAQDGITTQTYTLAVNRAKADQAITFPTLQPVTYGAEDLALKATSSNASLPITYSSSNALVAIIINGKIHINGAGTTTITATQAGDAGYSDAVAVKQAFVVNKMPLTVTVNDVFRTYGKNNPDFTITYDGFANGDNLATLTTPPTVFTTANITTTEGVYDLIPAGAVAANYSFNYIKGKLTITVPVDNIQVSAVSATCKNQNDGSINIAAVRKLNYTASLAGKTYTFNDKLAIGNLTPGSYTLCITADGLPDYNQCFTLTITEPLDLSVYSVVNKQVNTISLILSGSDTYTIVLNGKTYQTKNNSITLPLFGKINKLVVNGDKLCQGVIERDIVGSDNMVPYPNPFQNLVYLNLGETVQSACVVKIVNMTDGKVKVMQTFTNQSGIIQINVSGLSLGVYALQ